MGIEGRVYVRPLREVVEELEVRTVRERPAGELGRENDAVLEVEQPVERNADDERSEGVIRDDISSE